MQWSGDMAKSFFYQLKSESEGVDSPRGGDVQGEMAISESQWGKTKGSNTPSMGRWISYLFTPRLP